MATVLLKNVVASKPAIQNLSAVTGIAKNETFPYQATIPIVDTAGNSIDATGGTVTFTATLTQLITQDNTGVLHADNTISNAMTATATVAGSINLVNHSTPPKLPSGTYAWSVSANDSAGGVEQLLAYGTMIVSSAA